MKNYTHINDLENLQDTVHEAIELKNNEKANESLGKGKTICLLFFNNGDRRQFLRSQKIIENTCNIARVYPLPKRPNNPEIMQRHAISRREHAIVHCCCVRVERPNAGL